jgi:hypothetical protein
MEGRSELMDRRKGATRRSIFSFFLLLMDYLLSLLFLGLLSWAIFYFLVISSFLPILYLFFLAPLRSFLRGESVRIP